MSPRGFAEVWAGTLLRMKDPCCLYWNPHFRGEVEWEHALHLLLLLLLLLPGFQESEGSAYSERAKLSWSCW